MKKLLALLLVAVIAAAALSLVACGGTDDEVSEGKATVVVYSETAKKYSVDLSKLGEKPTVLKALEYLNNNKGLALAYTYSEYGAYLTEFDVLKEDKEKYNYLYFWTSVEEDWDVSKYATQNYYADKKLVSSGLGVSSASLCDGAVVLFAYYGTADVSIPEIETASIVIGGDDAVEYTVDLKAFDGRTVIDAMEYLCETEGVALTYSNSEYGAYVTEFGSLKEDSANAKYVIFYTSVKKNWDISAYATLKYYNNEKLVSSGLGVSSATIEDDAVIYFDYMTFASV